MRKIPAIVLILLSATILLMNCENNTGTESQKEKHFVTISYHSEGHTEGEPPVDENKYEIEKPNQESIFGRIKVTVQDFGTLKKDGKSPIKWVIKPIETIYPKEFLILPKENEIIAGDIKNGDHLEFHAVWSEQ